MNADLIRTEESDGFPTDYVIARIKGRGTTLVSDWRRFLERDTPPETTDERIWEALLRELEWLHAQMNRHLRETFAPLFALFEIKTIVLCMRNRALGRTGEIARLLEHSLLAGPVKRELSDPSKAAAWTARSENALMRVFLEETAAGDLEPALKAFFTLFIDLRNLMLIYKRLRWTLAEPCPFITGGSIELSLLENVRDETALDELLWRVTGLETVSVAASEGALESILLRNLTRQLLKRRRAADDAALIVAYVWRLYVQARNEAILHHGAGLERETLERELIL